MTERLIEKLDRLGAEAGIKQMTPEVYRFALDVRKDLVSEWPKREWVSLTDEEIDKKYWAMPRINKPQPTQLEFARAIEQLLKEKNNG